MKFLKVKSEMFEVKKYIGWGNSRLEIKEEKMSEFEDR